MGDSMEEDFDSVGVIVANGSGSHAFTGPHNSMGYATSAPTAGTAGVSEALRGPPEVWARKRGRPGLEGVGEASTSANCARIVTGVHLPSTRGRESPDSDMSSSGSDVSINRAIKRMRIDQHNLEQQQRQLNDQQHPPSEFGILSSGGGSRPPPAWSLRAGVGGDIDALRRKHAELATEAENARINSNPARPTAAPIPLHHRVAIPQAVHHPRLLTITERSLSDSLSSIGNGTSGPLLERSTSVSALQSRAAGGPRLTAPSDSCAAFSPFTPRPPAEARYVKGIRVQADAPADVDYSNVNHALRQLHMERKMMSAGRESIGNGGSSAGGCPGLGRPSR